MVVPMTKTDHADALASLEDRIVRAVETVNRLRQDMEAAEARAQSTAAEFEAAKNAAATLKAENERLTEELEALRAERKQVRGRIEKLLSQLDTLAS
jgi:chromosome segregation ATPase